MTSRLYFLHIPKTGGINILGKIKINSGVSPFVGFSDSSTEQFNSSSFIAGHFGKTPITKNPDISVACLVREPIQRSVSNFIHSYITAPQNVKDNEAYKTIDTVLDKLRYYLFQDPYYSTVKNIQSRSIFNNMTNEAFENLFKNEDINIVEKNNNIWYLEDNDFVLEDIINMIDSFDIVETTDNHEMFYNKIKDWFLHNLGVEFSNIYFSNIPSELVDESSNKYTTQSLIDLLTETEKQKILDDNSIDFALYNYIKSKNG
jgi:hypothetical protein